MCSLLVESATTTPPRRRVPHLVGAIPDVCYDMAMVRDGRFGPIRSRASLHGARHPSRRVKGSLRGVRTRGWSSSQDRSSLSFARRFLLFCCPLLLEGRAISICSRRRVGPHWDPALLASIADFSSEDRRGSRRELPPAFFRNPQKHNSMRWITRLVRR